MNKQDQIIELLQEIKAELKEARQEPQQDLFKILDGFYHSVSEDGVLRIENPVDSNVMTTAIKKAYHGESFILYRAEEASIDCKRIVLAGEIPERFKQKSIADRVVFED